MRLWTRLATYWLLTMALLGSVRWHGPGRSGTALTHVFRCSYWSTPGVHSGLLMAPVQVTMVLTSRVLAMVDALLRLVMVVVYVPLVLCCDLARCGQVPYVAVNGLVNVSVLVLVIDVARPDFGLEGLGEEEGTAPARPGMAASFARPAEAEVARPVLVLPRPSPVLVPVSWDLFDVPFLVRLVMIPPLRSLVVLLGASGPPRPPKSLNMVRL